MTFSTLNQIQEILGDTRDEYVPKIRARQAEVHAIMLRALRRCDPNRIPAPALLAAAAAPAASMNISTAMPTGSRRILFVISGISTWAGGEELSITGPTGEATVTDTIAIDRNGAYLTHIAFDSLPLSGGPISANAALISAGGFVTVYENVGEISDIEARWVAGKFEDEEAKHRSQASTPPEEHFWIVEAKQRWSVYLSEYCDRQVRAQRKSITVSRGSP